MLNTLNSKKKTIYGLVALFVVSLIAFLLFIFTKAGSVPSNQFQNQPPISSIPPSNNVYHTEHSANQTLDTPKNKNNTEPTECSARCTSTLSLLDQNLNLDDEKFRELRAQVNELAAYLQTNESKRKHYLEVAMTTTNSDKRGFITDIFKHLPPQQKTELGESLINAENWRARAGGLSLITDDGVSNVSMANKLIDMIANEESSYIKSTALTHIKQSEILKGDTEFLYKLDSIINNDASPATRVAALKTKMQLSEQPFHILPDAVQALHTSEPELQVAGLIAIDQILDNEDEHIKNGANIDRKSIENSIQRIRNLSAYGDDKNQLEFLIRNANTIHSKHFEN